MNTAAQKHLDRARDYIAKGDEFYRKARPEIVAAHDLGLSAAKIGRYLRKSGDWVRDVLAWDGEGTLYGNDTERRRTDQAKQILREAPLEQVEQIIGDLSPERQQAVAAAAGHEYHKARQEYAETERNLTPVQRKEREAAVSAAGDTANQMLTPFTMLGIEGHLEQALEEMRELAADRSVGQVALTRIRVLLEMLVTEYQVAAAMAGLDTDLEFGHREEA